MAFEAALEAIRGGMRFYLRSDIQGFFTKIPRGKVVDVIVGMTGEKDFAGLFDSALRTELANQEELGASAALFPLEEEGVAQGSCLSPLAGNIVLGEFDSRLNGRGVACLRYVDDFLLLGTSEGRVEAAFRSAQSILQGLGMVAYDPACARGKAERGWVKDGFTFLGCTYSPGLLQPSKKARTRLLQSVKAVLDESARLASDPRRAYDERRSLSYVLSEVNNILRGWGNQYAFCNAADVVADLDTRLCQHLQAYLEKLLSRITRHQTNNDLRSWRRSLGIFWLGDSKRNPISVP